MGNEMLKTWLKHKEKMLGALNAQAAEKAAQYAAHTERLEQRMQVWNGSSPTRHRCCNRNRKAARRTVAAQLKKV